MPALYIATGLLLGSLLSHALAITIDPTIALGDLLELAVTIVIGTVVATRLTKISEDHRRERDLFIDEIDKVTPHLDTLHELRSSGQAELTGVNFAIKQLRTKNNSLLTCMRDCGINKAATDLADLSHEILELRNLFTFTTNTRNLTLEHFANTANCPTYVREGIITWSSQVTTGIDHVIGKCREKLFKAKLSLNKL